MLFVIFGIRLQRIYIGPRVQAYLVGLDVVASNDMPPAGIKRTEGRCRVASFSLAVVAQPGGSAAALESKPLIEGESRE